MNRITYANLMRLRNDYGPALITFAMDYLDVLYYVGCVLFYFVVLIFSLELKRVRGWKFKLN